MPTLRNCLETVNSAFPPSAIHWKSVSGRAIPHASFFAGSLKRDSEQPGSPLTRRNEVTSKFVTTTARVHQSDSLFKSFFPSVLIGLVAVATASAKPVNYSENVDGDLPWDGNTTFTLDVGVNTITGGEGGSAGVNPIVGRATPQVSANIGDAMLPPVTPYGGTGATGGGNGGPSPTQDLDSFFFVVPTGMEVTVATVEGLYPTYAEGGGGWNIYQGDTSGKHLGFVGIGGNDTEPMPGAPYAAGTYEVFPTATEEGGISYRFSFTVTTTPEPTTLALASVGSMMLLRRRPRAAR